MEDFLWELNTERFLKGEMTPEELRVFEQEQEENAELKAYVMLSMQLQQALSEKDWFSQNVPLRMAVLTFLLFIPSHMPENG